MCFSKERQCETTVNSPQPRGVALALLQMSGERTYRQMFLTKIKCSRQICIIFYESALCLTFRNNQHPTVLNGGGQGDITFCMCNSPNVLCSHRSVTLSTLFALPRNVLHTPLSGTFLLTLHCYIKVRFPSHYLFWSFIIFFPQPAAEAHSYVWGPPHSMRHSLLL